MLCLLISSGYAAAQVLTATPAFPSPTQPFTFYFDATQGNGGLADCNCEVYLHTGVITNLSTSQSDWKHVVTTWGSSDPTYKMTKVSDNVYSYTINNAVEFYGVPETETIQKLAFVFRNANGSQEGKDVGNADIYLQMYEQGLYASFTIPGAYESFSSLNQTVTIAAESSQPATLELYLNNSLLQSASNTQNIEYFFTPTEAGHYYFKIKASTADAIAEDSAHVVVQGEVPIAELPLNVRDGVNYISDNSVILSLYAPDKNFVYVVGDFNNWELHPSGFMNRTPEGNRYWLQIDNLEAGKSYAYQYFIDGSIKVADPYSELVLDPFNDGYISESTFPDMPAYPASKTNGIASVLQTAQTPYQWSSTDFQRPDPAQLNVYELLIRDFVTDHNYQSLIDSLHYLKNLGINAVELMPVTEFEGNISWGYNISYAMALDKYYGTKNKFKELIDSCHANGMAVIMDMVLNHHFGQNSLVQMYPLADNPWFNEVATHDFNVGYDFNHESPATKAYSKRIMEYWLEEYHIDGYRFDLSKGFTQKPTLGNVGLWGQYDASRIAIWKEYADFMWSIEPDCYVILEHFADNSEEKELTNYGMMVWGNFNHAFSEISKGYVNGVDFSWLYYKNRNFNNPASVGYMESHDEERVMYRCAQEGLASGNYNVKETAVALERIKLAAALFFSVPGPKMIWQFGELGYDYSINYNGRTGPKPIRWDYYFENERRASVNQMFGEMMNLRNNYAPFREGDATIDLNGSLKKISLLHPDFDVHVLANVAIIDKNEEAEFPHGGWWYEWLSGDSIEVSNVDMFLAFNEGEFRIYTTQKLPPPPADLVDLAVYNPTIEPTHWNLHISPNPATDKEPLHITFSTEHPENISLELYNSEGRKVAHIADFTAASGTHTHRWQPLGYGNTPLPTGIYFVVINGEQYYSAVPIIKQ